MRWRCPLPLLLFLLTDGSWGQSSGFRICAFNVQNLDTTKMTNTRVAHTLTRLVSRCDICLLQEVKDPQNAAIKVLVKALNSNTSDRYEDAHQYHFVSSKSLGNSDNLQQYVFIYRKNTVNMTGEYQYQTKKKSFVRPPFVVRVQSNRTAIGEFVLVPLHTDPQDAVQEINHLYDVFQEVSKKWKTKNLMFLGDFNAGCAHMTRPDKKKIRLFSEKGFYWLIGDKVDTTVTDMTCPYDRIVVHGDVFLKHIKPYSAKVFNFAKEFRLSKDRVLKVSDHFPVEVMLKASGLLLQATPLHLLLSLSVILWYCITDHRAV